MTQNLTGNRRPSPRATSALIFAGALLSAPAFLASAANAQVLGYAGVDHTLVHDTVKAIASCPPGHVEVIAQVSGETEKRLLPSFRL